MTLIYSWLSSAKQCESGRLLPTISYGFEAYNIRKMEASNRNPAERQSLISYLSEDAPISIT